jgi:seryl-tRNA synthetase
MIDIKLIEQNRSLVKESLAKRNEDTGVVKDLELINSERKELVNKIDGIRHQIKTLSQEVGKLKKSGEDASSQMDQVHKIKSELEKEETRLHEVNEVLKDKLLRLPNIVDSDVPEGEDESANLEVAKWGEPRTFNFEPKDHVTLGEELGLLDFHTAAKITGSRFSVYKGQMARLERALANFMLDQHLANGYEEIIPPFIVNDLNLLGTGQLPKFAGDVFKIEGRDWYLIPTAEVPLTNLKRESTFSADEFPLKYAGHTPCFRSEAGSYGKDTKGLIRLHQFSKVEMVNIVHPSASEQALSDMVKSATDILEALGLPYRAVSLCGGDIGFGAAKTIDLEVWIPAQNQYREISSISNCRDFQARRASIRFKEGNAKPQFAHTLNGSGLAVGRTVVAIMENYQLENGDIEIPEVLHSYMGGLKVISNPSKA